MAQLQRRLSDSTRTTPQAVLQLTPPATSGHVTATTMEGAGEDGTPPHSAMEGEVVMEGAEEDIGE